MITEKQCMTLIVEKFPGFKEMWQEHLEWWGEEESGLSNDMAVFSRYTIQLLKEAEKNLFQLKEIFKLIENFLINGSEQVKDAAATCFLENIINATSWEAIQPSIFIHLLGPESIKFCKAWDEFTGIKTEGLWNDHTSNNE